MGCRYRMLYYAGSLVIPPSSPRSMFQTTATIVSLSFRPLTRPFASLFLLCANCRRLLEQSKYIDPVIVSIDIIRDTNWNIPVLKNWLDLSHLLTLLGTYEIRMPREKILEALYCMEGRAPLPLQSMSVFVTLMPCRICDKSQYS